jgi:hypothetical protein
MDVVQDIIVDEDQAAAEDTRTNPITDPQSQIDTPEPEVKAEPEAKPADDPIPKGVQKRIDRAVRQKYEAEARTKMLEERLASLEQRERAPTYAKTVDDSEPTIDKFDNFDQYVAAKAEYIAKKQIESTLSAREQQQRAASEAAERTKTVESWNKRVEKATAELPDFEEAISSSDVPMTEPMRQAILESEIGPKLAYHLANNPEEAVKIANMSPIKAITALGRIEERLAAQTTAVKTTSAPPPITPVGSRATVKKDPGKMTDAEYAKWRKSGYT